MPVELSYRKILLYDLHGDNMAEEPITFKHSVRNASLHHQQKGHFLKMHDHGETGFCSWLRHDLCKPLPLQFSSQNEKQVTSTFVLRIEGL